jgi:hypothetical protein
MRIKGVRSGASDDRADASGAFCGAERDCGREWFRGRLLLLVQNRPFRQWRACLNGARRALPVRSNWHR